MQYKMIIFDWDGTLMDSAQAIVSALQATIKQLQLEPQSEQRLRYVIGLGMEEALDYLYPQTKIDRQQLAAKYRYNFATSAAATVNLYRNTPELLQQLTALNYQLAIATGKSRAGLNRDLAATNIGEFFVVTKTADETASKPDPLMLHEILDEFALQPQQALMVGDTEFDFKMADSIGMDCVLVAGGAHSVAHLQQFSATALLNRALDLPKWLQQQ